MACKPEREGAPNTRLQLTVAMHFGARESGGGSRESGALGRPQLKRHPLGRLLMSHGVPAAFLSAGLLICSTPLQASESGEKFVSIGGITLGRATFKDVQTRLGRTTLAPAADPHDEQLCYLLPSGDVMLLFVSNDLGGPEKSLIGFDVRTVFGARPPSCLQLSEIPFATDVGGIRLGMTQPQFLKIVGKPVKVDRKTVVREFARKELLHGLDYDIIIFVEGEFRGGKLIGFGVSKTETY